MMDIGQIAAAFGSIKAAKDIAEAMIGLRDAEAIRSKVLEMQARLLDAQGAMFSVNEDRTALITRVGDLENELTKLKNWGAEKQRYQLEETTPGIFVYALKPAEAGGEPAHQICANCYQSGKKGILQGQRRTNLAGTEILTCPNGCPPLQYRRNDLPQPQPRLSGKPIGSGDRRLRSNQPRDRTAWMVSSRLETGAAITRPPRSPPARPTRVDAARQRPHR